MTNPPAPELSGGPASGLRVVEMTNAIQGPAAGVFLSDMGAEIVKIEPPVGELNRYLKGPGLALPPTASGAQFNAMNRGKRSVCLDVHSPLGRSVVERLLEDADVFLTNYRREAVDRMGLGYEELHARHPRLVYARVNGFGPRGPDAGKAMLDGAAVARGGLAGMSGPADGPPMPPGAAIADTSGAMQLALGVMTALYARERTGRGQLVETSALGAQLWLQMWEIAHSSMSGVPLRREGAHLPTLLGPYGIYTTSDGDAFLFAVAMDEASWDAFCLFAGVPELLLDARWNSPVKRLGSAGSTDGVDEVRGALRRAFASKTTEEWETFLASQPEIIYERIRSHDEVVDDPQVVANDYVTSLPAPGWGPTKFVGNLVHMSETPGSVKGSPPELGEATAAVMRGLGFSDDEVREVEGHARKIREELLALLVHG